MKKKTFWLLTHIPFCGTLIKHRLTDPFVGSTAFLEEGYYTTFLEFQKKHPDVAITKDIAQKLMMEHDKKEAAT